MANLGPLGSPGVFNSIPPHTPPHPEHRQDSLLARLGMKTGTADSKEYTSSKLLFGRLAFTSSTSGSNSTVPKTAFVDFSLQHFSHVSSLPDVWRAAFDAADMDGSGRLNAHEFSVIYRAMVSTDVPEEGSIGSPRSKSLPLPIPPPLPPTDRSELSDVELSDVELNPNSDVEPSDVELSDVEPSNVELSDVKLGDYAKQAVACDDVRKKHKKGEEEVCASSSSSSSLSSSSPFYHARDASVPEIARIRLLCSLASSPPALRQVVYDEKVVLAEAAHSASSVPIGPRAVNAGLVLEPAMRAEAESDWRGAIAAKRDTERFRIAKQVAQWAQGKAAELARPNVPDQSDDTWLPSGSSLLEILGTADVQEQASRIHRISVEARRLIMAQPTVVIVPAPAKVFGDIHGQLRDLLLLFGHHGFPSHWAGGEREREGGRSCVHSFLFVGFVAERPAQKSREKEHD